MCRNAWPLGWVGAKFSTWARKRFVNAYFAFENDLRAKES
ncbi:phosphoenolpyruvate carboxylase [Acetobacter orientalis]|uniref:Phosphoenolpyruvate carboxylase n=1 Tax=Acetobacter orientalis TaxID=146474 RepID=A0A2Z5ZFX6_9PROT|nr:phosphoenolpyruvate carboxylase [Acetobacter orientalis]